MLSLTVLRRWPRTTALAIGCVLALVLAGLVEAGLRLTGTGERVVETFGCRTTKPEFAGRYRANCETRWVAHLSDRLVYDVHFSSDGFGRRLTPQSAPEQRSRLALFMGCSFTLGTGVEDDQTLPYYFGESARRFRVLNYGISGAGPQQMLVRLQAAMPPDEIGPYAGTPLLVYTMMGDHVGRARGSRRIVGTYGAHLPSFALDPNGGVRLQGSFREAYPWRTALARIIEKSYLLRRLPDTSNDADIELAAQIILAARERFRQRFGSDHFLVLAYPGTRAPEIVAVLARLRQLGVAVLDPKGVFKPGEKGLRLLDHHPRPVAHSRVAARLASELQAMGWLDDAPTTPPASR